MPEYGSQMKVWICVFHFAMVVQLQIASYICQTFTTEPENIKNK